HCLLISKRHHPSFACVPDAYEVELSAFRARCLEVVSSMHGVPLQFEHGSTPSGQWGGACVHHAHIHLVPVRAPVERWLAEYGDVQQLSAPFSGPTEGGAYLAYIDQNRRGFVVQRLDTPPPCQFIRRRLADHLHLSHWNWKASLLES